VGLPSTASLLSDVPPGKMTGIAAFRGENAEFGLGRQI
jgi:hypothetical protein